MLAALNRRSTGWAIRPWVTACAQAENRSESVA
jgi:hypothetical protein